jgi:hypothetical protein
MMHRSACSPIERVFAAAMIVAVLLGGPLPMAAFAENYEWNIFSRTRKWRDLYSSIVWTNGYVPTAGGGSAYVLGFNSTGAGGYTSSNDFAGTFTLSKLNVSGWAALTLAGGKLQFAGSSARLLYNSLGALTISNDIELSVDTVFDSSLSPANVAGMATHFLMGTVSGSGKLTRNGAFTLVLAGNANTLQLVSTNNQSVTFTLGAITRSPGATINFTTNLTGSGSAVYTTTTANQDGTILGGWATFGSDDWVTASGAGPTYTLAPMKTYGGLTVGADDNMTVNQTLGGNLSLNSFRAGSSAALAIGANVLTISSGGILGPTCYRSTDLENNTETGAKIKAASSHQSEEEQSFAPPALGRRAGRNVRGHDASRREAHRGLSVG